MPYKFNIPKLVSVFHSGKIEVGGGEDMKGNSRRY